MMKLPDSLSRPICIPMPALWARAPSERPDDACLEPRELSDSNPDTGSEAHSRNSPAAVLCCGDGSAFSCPALSAGGTDGSAGGTDAPAWASPSRLLSACTLAEAEAATRSSPRLGLRCADRSAVGYGFSSSSHVSNSYISAMNVPTGAEGRARRHWLGFAHDVSTSRAGSQVSSSTAAALVARADDDDLSADVAVASAIAAVDWTGCGGAAFCISNSIASLVGASAPGADAELVAGKIWGTGICAQATCAGGGEAFAGLRFEFTVAVAPDRGVFTWSGACRAIAATLATPAGLATCATVPIAWRCVP